MAREPRFPGIIWYCDRCGACLSTQKGFDDHKYTWKCKECGYKNSISWDNINSGDSIAAKILLYFLGFLSFVGFWTSLMLGISLYVFHADKSIYLLPFFIFIGLYLIAFTITIVLQFTIRHKKKTTRGVILEILYDLKEDFLVPFMAVKEILCNLLSFITHLIPIKRKYIGNSNKTIIVLSVVYIVLTAVEIITFNRINSFTAGDWWALIQSGYTKISELVIGLFQ